MRIALCQINNTVGDLDRNMALVLDFARRAAMSGADLAVFPELALNGYPPRDLLEKPSFLERSIETLERLVQATAGIPCGLVVGYVGRSPENSRRAASNSAALIERGRILASQSKMLLPTYDVFDEGRYFQPASTQQVIRFRDASIGLTICEDAWNDKQFWDRPLYDRDPVESLVRQGAGLIISINGSPYDITKRALRRQMFTAMAQRHGLPHVYVNMVGGNDQLIFDGSSFAVDPSGKTVASAPSFAEDIVLFDSTALSGERRESHASELDAVYDALVLGTRDYVRKCGFHSVLIGLSGGIDSSLVACLAVEAIGKDNVTGIAMPGPYSSQHSLADARALAANLGIGFEVVSITAAYQQLLATLDPLFRGAPRDVTEENIQARLRGLTLMSLSNKWGAMVLTTGNKSEMAVGYCTLYGDMAGGLAVISDVPKTMVYDLCRRANLRLGPVIPENVFTKPPSAELRPNQKDSDSLPEYCVLDPILKAYVEEMKSPPGIASELNLPLALVRGVINKVDRNEYKRQQAAPGLKVTTKAFGMGRRFPIAQRFLE